MHTRFQAASGHRTRGQQVPTLLLLCQKTLFPHGLEFFRKFIDSYD